MLDWKIHLIFGFVLILVWFNLIYFFKIVEIDFLSLIILVFLSLFASLFADNDLKTSKIRDYVSLSASFFISSVYIYFYQSTWFYGPIYFLFVYLILKNLPTKHRGLAHSFKFSLIFSVLVTFLIYLTLGLSQLETVFWFSVMFSSYSLHLVLDRIWRKKKGKNETKEHYTNILFKLE